MNPALIRLKESTHTKQQRQKAMQFLIQSLICTFSSDSTSAHILSVAQKSTSVVELLEHHQNRSLDLADCQSQRKRKQQPA
jgi:hypothetical protein